VAVLDCSEESRGERAEGTGVKERGKVFLKFGHVEWRHSQYVEWHHLQYAE
jgi:hypothetical protein